MSRMRIAIPSEGGGGLDGLRSGHFGHCDVFTFVDLVDGKIEEVTTVPNVSHVQGGCMVPVNLLASHKVDALIVGGIGLRPLMGRRRATGYPACGRGHDRRQDTAHRREPGLRWRRLLSGEGAISGCPPVSGQPAGNGFRHGEATTHGRLS